MALTTKRKKFIEEYLKCFNATQAAKLAGYGGDDNSLSSIGYHLLRDVEVSETLKKHFQASAMSADEVLQRLADLSRNAEKESDRIKALELLSKRWGILQEKLELSGSLEQTLVILPSKEE